MGFAGFGKKGEDKELKKKQQAEMIASTKRTPVVQEDDNSATERSTNPFDAIVDKSVDKASDDDADDDDDVSAKCLQKAGLLHIRTTSNQK